MAVVRIAVVGAGIIGLSSAVCIQEDLKHLNVQVTILAERIDINTTSDGAAGIFHPDHVDVDNVDHLKQWIADSAEKYWGYANSDVADEVGVFELGGYAVSNFDMRLVDDPTYHRHVKNHRRLEGHELDKLGGGPWRYGSFKTTVVTESRLMMKHLFGQFTRNGGVFQSGVKLNSLVELVGDYDLVVNCSGLGARNLVGDSSMYPIRGQVMRVRAPWIKQFYFSEDNAYIIPNTELVVVGGTRQKNNWSLELSREDRETFMENNSKMLPSIKKAEMVREWVGLRPGRPTVRLEKEVLQFAGDRSLTVVHNYGHGGNGIALSWGCGKHVAALVGEAVGASSARPKNLP